MNKTVEKMSEKHLSYIFVSVIITFLITSAIAWEDVDINNGEFSGDKSDLEKENTVAVSDEDLLTNKEGSGICPSYKEYEDTKKSPVVSSANQSHVLVEWSHLWPDKDWRQCISDLYLVLDDNVIQPAAEVTQNFMKLKVDQCKKHSVKIKIRLREGNIIDVYSNEVLIEPPNARNNRKHPKILDFFASKENGHFLADYLKENEVTTNISCYRIIGNLSNIFEENYYEENACNTVKKLELVFREKGIVHENDWKTAKEIATPKRHEDFSFQLDEVVCGFSNFCAVYEIGLRIIETALSDEEAIDNYVVPLTSVGPVDFTNNEVKDAVDLQKMDLEGPTSLKLLYAKPNSIAIQWEEDNNNCFSGHYIQVKNHEELDQLGNCLIIIEVSITLNEIDLNVLITVLLLKFFHS